MEGILNSAHQRQGKKTRGKQKIEMKKIEEYIKRFVCFSKRKTGIFTLCNAETAVIILSQKNKAFSYGEVDKLLDRYLRTDEVGNNGSSSSQLESNKPQSIAVQEQKYWKAVAKKEELKRQLETAEGIRNLMKNNGDGFWWEADIETMEKEELEDYKKLLEELKKNVRNRIGEISVSDSVGDESKMTKQFIMDEWSSDFFGLLDNEGSS